MALKVLLPVRFLLFALHLIIDIVIAYNRAGHVAASIPPSTASLEARAMRELNLTFDWLFFATGSCFAIEFLGMFLGFSLYVPTVPLTSIVAHASGFVLCVWLTMEVWSVQSFSYIFGCCSLLPALLELYLMGGHFLQMQSWQKLELRL
jgi:hypothetical protein